MGQVIKMRGAAANVDGTAAPMRQPKGGTPASQCVSLGTALDNLLEKLERGMDERAITKTWPSF